MKKWIALCLAVSPAFAFTLRCADWEVGVAALYWRPCAPSFEFAEARYENTVPRTRQVEDLDKEGKVKKDKKGNTVMTSEQYQAFVGHTNELFSVDPDYQWGARVFVGYVTEDCCNFGRFDWTYVRIADARAAHKQDMRVIGFANTSEVTGRLKHRYNRVNLRFGHRFYCGCNVNLYAYAGGRFVDIHRRERVSTPEGNLRQRSKFSGGGLEVGLLGTYDLGCGVHVVGNLGGLTILGRQRTDVCQATTVEEEHLAILQRTQCVAGWDVRGGINYSFCCWCFNATLEIGYEMNYYLSPLALHPGEFGVTISSANADNRTRTVNVGFGGPYLSLMLRF